MKFSFKTRNFLRNPYLRNILGAFCVILEIPCNLEFLKCFKKTRVSLKGVWIETGFEILCFLTMCNGVTSVQNSTCHICVRSIYFETRMTIITAGRGVVVENDGETDVQQTFKCCLIDTNFWSSNLLASIHVDFYCRQFRLEKIFLFWRV